MNKYRPKNINKIEAQKLYDTGLSLRQLAGHFGVVIDTITRLKLKTRTLKEARRCYKHTFSPQGIEKLSRLAKERNLGGYRPHPNRGMRYKNIWFDSEWEVRVAKSLDENQIVWTRPKTGFVWNENNNKYFPDFYLPTYDVYLDPKNDYLIEKDREKINRAMLQNNITVVVLNKNQLDWQIIKPLIS